MINTNINFMGFYNSIHSDNVDHAIECYFSDEDGNFNYDDVEDQIEYDVIHNNYMEFFCNKFEEWVKNKYPLTPSFCNLKLISPKFYNYSTDVINCEMQESDVISMINFFKDDQEFLSFLKDRTKSYDGYISFYTFESALSNKDDILSDYILEFLVRKFEFDGFELDNYEFMN